MEHTNSMRDRMMRAHILVSLVAFASTAIVHLGVYRMLWQMYRANPNSPVEQPVLPFLMGCIIVMLIVASRASSLRRWYQVLIGAFVSAVAVQVYFLLVDVLEIGWGNLVLHDIWVGDLGYWRLAGARAATCFTGFLAASLVAWRIRSRRRSD